MYPNAQNRCIAYRGSFVDCVARDAGSRSGLELDHAPKERTVGRGHWPRPALG